MPSPIILTQAQIELLEALVEAATESGMIEAFEGELIGQALNGHPAKVRIAKAG